MSDHDISPVQQCPQCTALVEAGAAFCRTCGQLMIAANDSAVNAAARSGAASDPQAPEVPFTVSGELVPRRRTVERESFRVQQWSLALLGGAGILAVVAAIVAFGWLHAQSPETAPVQQAAAPPAAPPPVIVEPPPAQRWLGRRQASWASDGSKTITFELPANADVPVWMAKVRPQLVVRCVSRTTEVFVSLGGSAASVEQQTGSHTVRIQIDDDPEVLMQWSDSVSSQELFAPDGLALTKRLADAQRMRFGFTPFNAQPVVVDFSVDGFDELAPLVANTCGWRLDDGPVYQAPRSARLK